MTPAAAGASVDVLVIGAGQAGLAMGYQLAQRRVRFQILDAGAEIGQAWRSRWDSLRLFTPAQYDNLPGLPFPAAHDTYPARTTSRTTCRTTPPPSTCPSGRTPR